MKEQIKENILGAIIFLFLIIFVGLIILSYTTYNYNANLACKNLGFIKWGEKVSGVNTCQDIKGNLYFVKLDCKSFFVITKNCIAKEISVGGVWIAK